MKENDNKGRLSLPVIHKEEIINYLYSKQDVSPIELFDEERVPPHQRQAILNETFQHYTKCSFNAYGRFMTRYQIAGINKSYTADFPKVKSYEVIKDIDKLTENINRTRDYREQMKARSTYLFYKKKTVKKQRENLEKS